MATFSMELPPQLQGNENDVVQLRQYLARLVDRLLYTLNHLDTENLVVGGVEVRNIRGGAAGIADAALAKIGTAEIGRATAQHLNAQVAEIVTGVIQTAVIDWAHVTNMEVTKAYVEQLRAKYADVANLEAAIATIADARIAEAEIGEAEIENLKAYAASIVNATIQTAEIDWAQLKTMVGQEAIVARVLGEKMFIDRLGVTSAQMVDLTVGTLCVKASDGEYYALDVDLDTGQVSATKVTPTSGEIAAGITDSGQHIVETDLTAQELQASNITAVEALISKLTAARIDVDTLFAREATIERLTTGQIAARLGESLNLSSNQSIIASVKKSEDWATLTGRMSAAEQKITDESIVSTVRSSQVISEAVNAGMADAAPAVVKIDSSRGTCFKDSQMRTELRASVYWNGRRIEDIATLHEIFGATAYLQWEWRRAETDTWSTFLASDSHISQGGFVFSVTPADVDATITFRCSLIT